MGVGVGGGIVVVGEQSEQVIGEVGGGDPARASGAPSRTAMRKLRQSIVTFEKFLIEH